MKQKIQRTDLTACKEDADKSPGKPEEEKTETGAAQTRTDPAGERT